jgi:DUF4097 and DUF4098 domain-containing protein YvlB
MEIYAFLKTMNNQIQKYTRLFLSVTAAFALFVLSAPCVLAQGGDRIAVNLSDPARPAVVKVSLLNGGITVKGTDGKEVVVVARVRNQESSKAQGTLRRVPMTATGLSVEEESNQVRIGVDALQRTIDLEISVPRRTSLNLSSVNDGNIHVSDVEGEFDINNVNGEVTLANVAGSAVAHALNGKVLVTFTRADPQKAMSFSSLNGDIDVTFPADLKANVSFRTDNGEVFSDFDIQVQASAPKQITEGDSGKGKYKVKIDKTVNGTINGGGQSIQFKNFNGDIYIRKAGSPR